MGSAGCGSLRLVALVPCRRYPPWVRAFPFKSPLPGHGKHQPVNAIYFGKPHAEKQVSVFSRHGVYQAIRHATKRSELGRAQGRIRTSAHRIPSYVVSCVPAL
jgi:hypothetical protein